jgi:hypothetical protein
MNQEEKIAHLGFIQSAIARMAGNVFLVKGWTVALVAAMTALTSDSRVGSYIAIIPAMLFWWLDAYYMRQEKLFRELYKEVSINNNAVTAFSMDTSAVEKSVDCAFRIMFTKTVSIFYILIFALLFVFATKGLLWGKTEINKEAKDAESVTRETYIILLPHLSPIAELSGTGDLFHQPK